MRPNRSTAFLVSLAALAGCSAEGRVKLVPVVGTVTRGGKPLADAALSFVPEPGNRDSTPGTASSGPTGYYAAMWLTRTGLAPGSYKVLITAEPNSGTDVPPEFKDDPLMAKFQSEARQTGKAAKASAVKSEFKREVVEGGGPYDFDVGPAPK